MSMARKASTLNDHPAEIDWRQQAHLKTHWMPFTGNRDFLADPRLITSAKGCYYTAADGRKILDSLSGLWCASFGHCREEIATALSKAAQTLDYAPAFQFAHPLSFELANRIKAITPKGLDHVFFTNSGSESADTAVKMIRAYWRLKGQPEKVRIIGRVKGYHGVNVGGTSVGGIPQNRKDFGPLLDADHMPHTLLPDNRFSRGIPEHGVELADRLEEIIALHDPTNIAAVMVEPMSGSAGVIIPPAGYLQRLREICDRHNILLVFDEVLTGFGRLGTAFGADLFGVTPDIMTIAKNLTNGTVPMGAVLANTEIYQTFMEQNTPAYMPEFVHGYTYSAHPIACAAGLAAMDIFESDRMLERAAALAPYFEEQVHGLRGLPHVVDIRNLGLAAAIQIEAIPGEPGRRPWALSMAAWKRGLYLRFGGDTIQLGPPFISEPKTIDEICNILNDVLHDID